MRTTYCGEINTLHMGKKITICGWVDQIRNFGKLIFLDVRDCTGKIQVCFNIKHNNDLFRDVNQIKKESCLQISGTVCVRKKNTSSNLKNYNYLEIQASYLNIFNISEPLPIDFNQKISEEQRLKFRYLDLRRPIFFKILKLRSKVSKFIHKFMEKNKFIEIETPILSHSTIEGARDYLIPSRIHKNSFYALPQSPQIFKQLLMISGIDRYYQIARCFRDEDLRSDRQPEFTQIDCELCFADGEKVKIFIEKLIKKLWLKFLNIKLNDFVQISYTQSINKFGSDKPDLRNPIELINITNILDKKNIIYKKFFITAIKFSNQISLNQDQIKQYRRYVVSHGGNNLFTVHIEDLNRYIFCSKISKKIFLQNISEIITYTKSKIKNTILIVIEKSATLEVSGKLRLKLGLDLNLTNLNNWHPVWITDYPLFKLENNHRFSSVHHPFTAPKNMNLELLNSPINLKSTAYDLVINGYEIGSGSSRIHKYQIQKKIFEILGMNYDKQKQEFGFFLDALRYGAPPHAGFAFGLDRIIMLISNTNKIRNVIAFPKTTSASDLMTNSPKIIS
ncbi:aspartyl-tRNA synthetase [Wigglesworthia glossinidia endosymbiont of Glossina morsitans morsitans (Yale colony)]|uniref:Aspartate--tRNA ligase n=1 Tax=Wigglesworthia glossinidia endosymbiont of Glossina morsitans morsitans (Yale colony) TaxID=1142511 RepID=H6Q4B9_WIGGL|nr:aspartate--tRNA ligase [Wigglesworthia glossinidia]AFA40979.1 aspartyl-tRNA synthetase [Wigglesworthia glossinidia endosymbiont of Glossina morsitans morsitans (Yale colony)]